MPNNVACFTLLPIEFPASSVLTIPAKHYIYLKPYDPQIPDPNAFRSLLVANILVTAAEIAFQTSIRRATYCGANRTCRFQRLAQRVPGRPDAQNRRKWKRATVEDMQIELQARQLPVVWTRAFHPSGAHAVVVFVDRPSMGASLKAAKPSSRIV
jgi:hypothetical protein